MDRRRERRGVLDQSVLVTLLRIGSPSGATDIHNNALTGGQRPPPQAFTAQAIDTSGRGMRLLMPLAPPPGTTLKIETENCLMLAEVCYCHRVNDERFAVGVEISQSVELTSQLRKLADAVGVGAGGRRPVPG